MKYLVRHGNKNYLLNRMPSSRDFQFKFPGAKAIEVSDSGANMVTFMPNDLYESFTTSELVAAKTSNNPLVVSYEALLSQRRSNPIHLIHKDDAAYQDVIDLMGFEQIITEETAADYRNGIPISRLG